MAESPEKRGASAEKRERILQAAIKVFGQKGFYATRVSEIAKAAGVADGTIYLYFDNKDAVLTSIFEDRMTKLLAILEKIGQSQRSTEGKLRRIMELQLGVLEEERDLAEVITVCLRQSSTLLKQYAAPLFTQYIELIANLIARGQNDGVFRRDVNPRVAARALFGGLDGLALTWALTSASPPELRKAGTQFAMMFLDGLRTSRDHPSEGEAAHG